MTCNTIGRSDVTCNAMAVYVATDALQMVVGRAGRPHFPATCNAVAAYVAINALRVAGVGLAGLGLAVLGQAGLG